MSARTHTRTGSRRRLAKRSAMASSVAWVAVAIASCGGGLSGTYAPDGKSMGAVVIESFTFKPGGKVEVKSMGGTQEIDYAIEGTKVKLASNGNTQILTIDGGGCLDAGGMLGRFCKRP